jgi:hypothetical protein
MNKPLAIAFLIAGVLLLVFGLQANDSVSSETSKLFTGAPTNKALVMMVAGILAAVIGLVSLVRRPHSA